MTQQTPTPPFSKDSQVAQIQSRADLSNSLHCLFVEEVTSFQRDSELRRSIATDAITLTLELHGAIALLTRFGHYAGAHALLRPLNESCARALWLIYVAQPVDILALSAHQRTMDLDGLAKALMRKQNAKELRDLGRFLGPASKIFNSFTHGCFEQLRRRETGYEFSEVLGSLGFSDFVANVAVRCAGIVNVDAKLQAKCGERARDLANEVATLFNWAAPPASWNGELPRYPEWVSLTPPAPTP